MVRCAGRLSQDPDADAHEGRRRGVGEAGIAQSPEWLAEALGEVDHFEQR